MVRKQDSPEEIIGKLREAEAKVALADSAAVPAVVRRLEISGPTYYCRRPARRRRLGAGQELWFPQRRQTAADRMPKVPPRASQRCPRKKQITRRTAYRSIFVPVFSL